MGILILICNKPGFDFQVASLISETTTDYNGIRKVLPALE